VTKTRILFVIPALLRAGAECQLVALVNGLPGERFEKHLLSYMPGDDLDTEVDTSKVNLYGMHRKNRLDVSVGRMIADIIDEHEIDIVHCTLLNALIFGVMGKYLAKRKPRVISVIHTTKNENVRLHIADLLIHRHLLKRCEQIWFVSDRQAERWIDKMPFIGSRCRTIHNGIDVDEFDPQAFLSAGMELRENLGISHDEKVICSIAGFRPEKMHLEMIEAFVLLRSSGPRYRLLLAGKGPMERQIRDKVEELNLNQDVVFLGALPDVRSLLAASDCKVLVSAAETFSMAMLEAMAMQVPVITTSVGGAGEAIVNNVSGYLVAPGDIKQLAERFMEMLSDDDRRKTMGILARQIVIERFSIDKMIRNSTISLEKLGRLPSPGEVTRILL